MSADARGTAGSIEKDHLLAVEAVPRREGEQLYFGRGLA
jgi:hypothetical protein